MQSTILKPLESDEFFIEEGVFILENLNTPADPQVSIARARLPEGHQTRWHYLIGTTERYLIAAGRGRVEIGDLPPTEVSPGDVVLIPPGVRQRIENIGSGDLVFFCVCSPRFQAAHYREV
jgi:mannose-6-phosphate isomerase-like protein (cupin superfamily)